MALIKALVDDQLYQRLRREAFESHQSMSQIITAAVERYLDELDRLR